MSCADECGRRITGLRASIAPRSTSPGKKRFADTLRQERPDIVINAAAYTAVDRAESEPDVAWAVNAADPAIGCRL